MNLIYRGPSRGKTGYAVNLANESDAYLVVANQEEATRVQACFDIDRFPITYEEFKNIRGSHIKKFVIDDIERYFQWLHPESTIVGFSMTDEDEGPPRYCNDCGVRYADGWSPTHHYGNCSNIPF